MDHPNGPVTNGKADEDQGDSLTGKSLTEAQHVAFFVRASVQVFPSLDFNLKMKFEMVIFYQILILTVSFLETRSIGLIFLSLSISDTCGICGSDSLSGWENA